MKIRDDVMAVLVQATAEGNRLELGGGQLDRKLYLAVDKVLKAAGGKWNRSVRAHLFNGDAAEILDILITTGKVTTAREIGFFETPTDLAARLVKWAGVDEGHTAIEPSAGTGRIVEELDHAGAEVTVCERSRSMLTALADAGYKTFGEDDFLDVVVDELVDRIVMNPPFTKVGKGNHLDHVRHAFEMLKPGGVLVSVLPISVEWRNDRRHREFREWYEGLGGEVQELEPNAFVESGTSVRTVALRLVKPS